MNGNLQNEDPEPLPSSAAASELCELLGMPPLPPLVPGRWVPLLQAPPPPSYTSLPEVPLSRVGCCRLGGAGWRPCLGTGAGWLIVSPREHARFRRAAGEGKGWPASEELPKAEGWVSGSSSSAEGSWGLF